MTETDAYETVYRFAAFSARGMVVLRHDEVYVKTRTHLGWWEQTIPLSELKPAYCKLSATTEIFFLGVHFCNLFHRYRRMWTIFGSRDDFTENHLRSYSAFWNCCGLLFVETPKIRLDYF